MFSFIKPQDIFSYFGIRLCCLSFILMLFSISVQAQQDTSHTLIPFKKDNLWGLNNKSTGTIVFAARYDSVKFINDSTPQVWIKGKTGLLSVSGKEITGCIYNEISINKYGFIITLIDKKGMLDKNGKQILPCGYNTIFDFYDSIALVKKNNKYGFVNLNGKEVIPCDYDKIFWNKKKFNYFPGNKALVQKNGKFGIIDHDGNVLVPCQYDWEFYLPLLSNYSRVIQNDKKGLIDKSGKQVLPCLYDEVRWENDTTHSCNPSEISGKMLFTVKSNDKWGIVDENNNVIVPIKYEDIGNFNCGYAAASLYGKWGFINPDDSTMIPFNYDYCGEFRNGLAIASENVMDPLTHKVITKSGLIDKSGNTVIPMEYTISFLSDENIYLFSTADGKIGIADSNGKIIVQPEYKISTYWNSWKEYGIIKVYDTETKKIGFYSKEGKLFIPFKYDNAGYFSENLVAVKKDTKWGFLNNTGKEVISFQYDEANEFSDGMALIRSDKLYGYIDNKGKEIIALQYPEAGNFSGGYAKIMKNENYGLINKKGNTVISIEQENILFNNDLQSYFTEGLALVQHNDLFGYYDTSGVPVIPCKFNWADFFSNSRAVIIDSSGNYRYIDKSGKFAFPFAYTKAYSFYKGYAVVKEGKTFKMIDTAGIIINTFSYEEIKPFIDGPAAVRLGKLWGFIDEKGKLVLPLKYEKAASFRNGEAQVDIDGSTCRINTSGDIIGLGTK